jgi:hypothetical protein
VTFGVPRRRPATLVTTWDTRPLAVPSESSALRQREKSVK